MEEWRPVVGYEGIYEVSNLGRVKVLEKFTPYKGGPTMRIRREKCLSLSTDKYGYKIVGLTKNKKQAMRRVHRLVAEAFIPNPDGLPQINHKNNIRSNNNVDNLEWCTAKQNIRHKFNMGYSQKDRRIGHPVLAGAEREYPSVASAARAMGITSAAVRYRILSNNYDVGFKF